MFRGINRRWLINTFGVVLAIIILLVVTLSVAVHSLCYSTVETSLKSRSEDLEAIFPDYTAENADAFTLITGDSDLAAPVQAIRYQLRKPIAVFNPHKSTCLELKRFASFYKNIPADLPAQCQLPFNITLSDGTTIHAPTGWTTSP